jgi:hypothetical protein
MPRTNCATPSTATARLETAGVDIDSRCHALARSTERRSITVRTMLNFDVLMLLGFIVPGLIICLIHRYLTRAPN